MINHHPEPLVAAELAGALYPSTDKVIQLEAVELDMESLFSKVLFLVAVLMGAAAQAQETLTQEPSLEEANKVLDYAEQLYSDVVPVSAYEAGEAVEFGSRWYFRYYKDAGSYIAVNRDDDHLWVLGPHFGSGTEAIKVLPVDVVLALLARPGGEPIQQEADEIFYFAEEEFPELFPAPASLSGRTFEPGYRWFFRYYGRTNTYLAVNLDDGYVWAMGAGFGAAPTRLMSVGDALDLIPYAPGGDGAGIISPGNGKCVAVVHPGAGTQAVYRFDDTSANRFEFRREWIQSSPSILKMKSGTFVDGELQSSAITTTYYESHGGLRYSTKRESEGQDLALTPATFHSWTAYRPSQLVGPGDEYCEGQEWRAASILQTTVSSVPALPNTAQRNQSGERTYIVEAVDERISVPAGIFTTIKITLISAGGLSRVESWLEASSGVVVLSRVYWGEEMRSSEELLEVSY